MRSEAEEKMIACAHHHCARASANSWAPQRSSRVCEANVDDLLAAERSMHLEGKTNGNARGREIATCAAVGAEIKHALSVVGSIKLSGRLKL